MNMSHDDQKWMKTGSTSRVVPLEKTSPAVTADELLADGLLGFLAEDDVDAQEQRIAKVMAGIRSDAGEGRLVFSVRTARIVRRWGAVAAAVAVFGVVAILGIPGETSAQATIERTISLMRSSGDRRYEMRMIDFDQTEMSTDIRATVDTRSPNFTLIQTKSPEGRDVVVGRDAEGKWAIRRDGQIERRNPEIAWPRWATLGEESLFADSVDVLLDQMTHRYDLSREGLETLEGRGEQQFTHIRGSKKVGVRPGVRQVDVWIGAESKIVERVEMRWDPLPTQSEVRPPRNGRLEPEDRMDGPPEPERRPGGGPRGGPPDRPGSGLGSGPPDGPGAAFREVFAPLGLPPAMDGGRLNGPPKGPPNEVGGGGGGAEGKRKGPPKLLVLERVEAPSFVEGWFNPERFETQDVKPK